MISSATNFSKQACRIAIAATLLACSGSVAEEEKINLDTPDAMKNIDIVEHLGDKIPLDLSFTDAAGKAVQLKDLVDDTVPVILTLNYFECPMLCTLELNGMIKGLKEVSLEPGKDYRIVTVSIDPQETPELATSKGEHYRSSFDRATPESWQFFVGDEANITALSEAVGFKYFYDHRRDEWAHAAALFVLTPDGRISRYLYGIEFRPKDLKLSLLEASEGTIGTAMDKLLMFCFHYDPQGKKYALAAINVMRGGGALTVLILGSLMAVLWSRERRKKLHNEQPTAAAA